MTDTTKLYCTACHTCWIETVWREWQKCPFLDCGGRLSRTPPVGLLAKPRAKKEPPTYPLFEVAEQ